MENKEEDKNAGEPYLNYGKTTDGKSIQVFSSFDKQEEDNYKWLATLTPEQHLQNATALIKRIFAEDLRRNPKLGTKLTID
jgi:hypothetical protein